MRLGRGGVAIAPPEGAPKNKMQIDLGRALLRLRHIALVRRFAVRLPVRNESICTPARPGRSLQLKGIHVHDHRALRARLGAAAPVAGDPTPNDPIADAVQARSAWARLIYKVYEVDPLEFPKCKGPMQVIALIDDPAVANSVSLIQRINSLFECTEELSKWP